MIHFPAQLKDEAVGLCDVLAPPDHILQSAIGSSDGQVYEFECMRGSDQITIAIRICHVVF